MSTESIAERVAREILIDIGWSSITGMDDNALRFAISQRIDAAINEAQLEEAIWWHEQLLGKPVKLETIFERLIVMREHIADLERVAKGESSK